jgi:dihydrofolate synthase/folylpolyglutamate synthase
MKNMHSSTNLSTWLSKIETIHPKQIELGLDRVKKVANRLGLLSPSSLVIVVGGTNGKGSTVSGLEAIYLAENFQVGAFTSPILFKHNEQVRINGECASDEAFCRAFEAIDDARGEVLLTPFEFHTLAALYIFKQVFVHTGKDLDVLILEVGLGGRLDAVNILDHDLAIVTSIDLDHQEWLGETRDAIAKEKAGIFRKNKPAICGDPGPPASLLNMATTIGAHLYCMDVDYTYHENGTWDFYSKTLKTSYCNLPLCTLSLKNLSTVLMAITLLQDKLHVTLKAIRLGLSEVYLPGRIEIIEGPVTQIFDVSHNPAAVGHLAKKLKTLPSQGKTYAVFSMLADKDITESMRAIFDVIDKWASAPLQTKRSASIETLLTAFQINNQESKQNKKITPYGSIKEAYQIVLSKCVPGDRVIIFGSFHTVAECQSYREK